MRKAIGSLATFGPAITMANIKAVGKLPGVGKGTIAKVRARSQGGLAASGAVRRARSRARRRGKGAALSRPGRCSGGRHGGPNSGIGAAAGSSIKAALSGG